MDLGYQVLKGTPLVKAGTYGRVFAIKHSETVYAAKELNITEEMIAADDASKSLAVEQFLKYYSKLCHPNVVHFLGLLYNESNDVSRRPVVVMEMMVDSLTLFMDKHQKIPANIKFSIMHDVSLGLCYFHNHDPPIIHGELFPRKILLTAQHVAKISLGVTNKLRMLVGKERKAVVAPADLDFMPPEIFTIHFVYKSSVDIFSFARLVLYIVNQQWPTSSSVKTKFDLQANKSEHEKHQEHLDKMENEFKMLRQLVEECLDNDPTLRPSV